MRKLNLVFTTCVAVLLFFTIWNAFNFSYHFRIGFFETEKIQSGELVHINALISTHGIEDIPSFKQSLVDFFYTHDTTGRIHHIIIEDDLKKTMHYYNYADASDSLFLFNLKPGVPSIEWKSRDEKLYYTNDGSSDNPNLIDYLDSSYYDYRDGLYRHTLNFYPMHHFEQVDNQKIAKSQVFVDLYMPAEDVEHVQTNFVKDVLEPIEYSFVDTGVSEGIFVDSTTSDLEAHRNFALNYKFAE